MISRRSRSVVSGLVATAVVALAAPVAPVAADDDAAARVGDTVISEADFVDLLERQADYERAAGAGGQAPIERAEGLLDGEVARGYLRNLIILAAVDEFVDSPLYQAPLADVSPASASSLTGDAPINDVFQRLVDAEARIRASELPDTAVLAETYDGHPARTGVVCVAPLDDASHVGAADAAAAQCIVLAQARSLGVDGAQFDQLRVGRPGDPVAAGGPLTDDADWAIAAFADAADEFDATLAPYAVDGSASMLLVFGVLSAAEVEVDDRWGRWDPLTFSVVP